MKQLSIIIVNYNTLDLLINCLDSLKPALTDQIELIVVDNHSDTNPTSAIKKTTPQAKIIINSDNLGFSRANNRGIQAATGSYTLLLNSDTLIKPDSITSMLHFAKTHPRVGILSPTLTNPDGSIQPNGGSLPSFSSLLTWGLFFDDLPIIGSLLPSLHYTNPNLFTRSHSLGWVSGAAMLISPQCRQKIGLLDENIFMYAEDIDYCWRASQAGFLVYNLATTSITHLGGQSSTQAYPLIQEFSSLKYVISKHKSGLEKRLYIRLLRLAAQLRVFVFGRIKPDAQKLKIYQQISKVV